MKASATKRKINWEKLARELYQIAMRRVVHKENGGCPSAYDTEDRDENCEACRILIAADQVFKRKKNDRKSWKLSNSRK